jgi:adenine-specific DNA-methyltransferase
MYNQFFNTVLEVLKQDQRFFTDNGELLRNSVYEAAMQMDSKLIKCKQSSEIHIFSPQSAHFFESC